MLYIVAISLTIFTGAMVALQPGMNSQLAAKSSTMFSVWTVFVTGTFFNLVYWLAYSNFGRDLNIDGVRSAPSFVWLAGVVASAMVGLLTISVQVLGASTTVACTISTQLISSIIFDTYGLIGYEKISANFGRLFGTALSVVAVILISHYSHGNSNPKDSNDGLIVGDNESINSQDTQASTGLRETSPLLQYNHSYVNIPSPASDVSDNSSETEYSEKHSKKEKLIYYTMLVASVFVGVLTTIQGGMMGVLASHTSVPFSSVYTMASASIFLSFYQLIDWYIFGNTFKFPKKVPFWAWLGGILEFEYAVVTAFLTPELGASLFFGLIVASELQVSLICDHFGLVGLDKDPVNSKKVMGVVLMIIAIAIVSISSI
ncbi:hypothetical protein BC833DRAFT_116543 [Globomyces pollinis-pini]|nr:hypothetical protein BC833DRAFT_116543 [Globomyces pollinis-pini]